MSRQRKVVASSSATSLTLDVSGYFMTTRLLIIFLFLSFFGCHNSNKDKVVPQSKAASENKLENSIVYNSRFAIWDYRYDTILKKDIPIKVRSFLKDTLTISKIVEIVNQSFPKVQIKYLRTSNDTIFLSIPESNVLTQQMGTTGAESYMVSTTFTFTELIGINYVSYDFDEGDHAKPGTYNRNSWDR